MFLVDQWKFHVQSQSVAMNLGQNELAYGVALEVGEELHRFVVHLALAEVSLILSLIRDDDDVVLFVNLRLYFHDLLQEKWRY